MHVLGTKPHGEMKTEKQVTLRPLRKQPIQTNKSEPEANKVTKHLIHHNFRYINFFNGIQAFLRPYPPISPIFKPESLLMCSVQSSQGPTILKPSSQENTPVATSETPHPSHSCALCWTPQPPHTLICTGMKKYACKIRGIPEPPPGHSGISVP